MDGEMEEREFIEAVKEIFGGRIVAVGYIPGRWNWYEWWLRKQGVKQMREPEQAEQYVVY